MNIIKTAATEWNRKQARLSVYHDYMTGRHQLRFATRSWLDTYGPILGEQVLAIRENLCPVAVSAFTDSIKIEAWGDDTDQGKAETAGLSRLEALVNREAWTTGDAYVLAVKDPETGEANAFFQPSHTIIPFVDETNPNVLKYAAKTWIDGHYGYLNFYSRETVAKYVTINPLVARTLPDDNKLWRPLTDGDGEHVTPHGFDRVPVCWFKRDAPTQTGAGVSILDDVIPLQDALNKSLADLIIVSGDYANPFWYLLNVQPKLEVPVNPFTHDTTSTLNTIKQTNRFNGNRQKIFTHDGPGPFGQLDPPDLSRLQTVQDGYAAKIARVIGIPGYYMTQNPGDIPSGEALRILTTRRNARINAWQRDNTPVWNGLKQLLNMTNTPIIWGNPDAETRREKLANAASMKTIGYPAARIFEYLDETNPNELAQQATQQQDDIARAFLNGAGY